MATRKKAPATPPSSTPPRKPAASSGAPVTAAAAKPRTLADSPADDPAATWQTTHDALQAAFDAGNQLLGHLPPKDPLYNTLNQILPILSDELTSLNQEEMRDRTISLKAASQQLGSGIAQLKVLKQQLAEIATTIAEVADVAEDINKAVSGLESFLTTFSAL